MAKNTPRSAAVAAFESAYTALKGYMLGKGYVQGLEALSFAELYHVGTRKDGFTPEFYHQIEICFTLINLRGLEDIEERCIVLALLHDIMEDYDVSFDEMVNRFDEEAAEDVYVLSKKHRGEVKDLKTYHIEIGKKPETILVKGADNSQNVQSMHGAFKAEKMLSYLVDTKTNKLPLLKLGRKRFPKYHFAFAGLSFMLKRQVALYEAHQKMASEESKRAKNTTDDEIFQGLHFKLKSTNEQLEAGKLLVKSLHEQLVTADRQAKNCQSAMIIAASKLSLDAASNFWNSMRFYASGRGTEFALPSSLLPDFKTKEGLDVDTIPGNSRPI
jgi:(p)ppGpp synthase/HD superfamily hydrolase